MNINGTTNSSQALDGQKTDLHRADEADQVGQTVDFYHISCFANVVNS